MYRSLHLVRSIRFTCFVGCLALLASGCTKPVDNTISDTNGKRTVVIGMVAKSESNDVFVAAHAGAVAAAKELADKYGVNVKIDWRTPSSEDASKQADFVRALANEGVDGIAVSCSVAQTLTGAINDAVDKGITVVCFDSDAPDSKRMAVYGTDDIQCGNVIMDELAEAMGGKGTVAILAGNPSAPNLQKRVQGVREALKKYPDIKELNDGKGVFYHEETPEKAVEAVNAAMTAYPGGIDGWAFYRRLAPVHRQRARIRAGLH